MNNKIHTKKAQFAPESVYTPAESAKGIKPVITGSGKGYALTTFPMADFLRSGDPEKAAAIQTDIDSFKVHFLLNMRRVQSCELTTQRSK